MFVGFGEEPLDAFAFAAIDGNADARRKRRLLLVLRHDGVNALHDALGFFLFCFRQHKSKFIAAVPRGGINGAAIDAKCVGNAANCAATDEVAVAIVNFFQAVEIEQEKREGAAGAVGALGFVFEDVKQAAIVGEAGERIADGEMADLFEEARVVEKRAAESNGVSHDAQTLRKNEWRVQQACGLRGRELTGKIEPTGGVDRAVEGGIVVPEAATVPDKRDKIDRGGKQLLRTRNEGELVRRHFRGQLADGGAYDVGEKDDGEKCAGDFALGVARTRQEFFNEERDDQEEREDHAAEPKSYGRPMDLEDRLCRQVEKEEAGGYED